MSASKHTPGPWQWVNKGGWYALESDSGTRVADDGSACDEYNREIDPEDEGESGANARLIAAAPELLEALLIARDYAGYAHAEPGDIALIDAAIAKATGA